MSQEHFTQIEDIAIVLQRASPHQLFLVADPNAYVQSGAEKRLAPFLAHHQTRCFSDFEANPKIRDVEKALELFADDREATVIAIGGGTAIDIAKLVCCFSAQDTELLKSQAWRLASDTSRMAGKPRPLIAIPTTAGTGSEATSFAVLYVNQTKHSVSHPSLLPNVVIADPTLTHSLPPNITASTGLDAVSQAIESMWSIRSTEDSIALADQALKLGLSHLETAVLAPTPTSRAAMMQAAHLAGRAINISRTTAPHAMSYCMTIRHQVPHGMAVAAWVAPFMRFNARLDFDNVADPRGVPHVRSVLGRIAQAFQVDPQDDQALPLVAQQWELLLQRIGCPMRLSQWGITDAADRRVIARSVNQQRLANNPRAVNSGDLLEMVEEIA